MSLLSATDDGHFSPATGGFAGRLAPSGLVLRLNRVFARIGAWLDERRDHDQIEALDEAMLRDIGLDRGMIGLGYRQARLRHPGRLPMFVAMAALLPMVAACSGGSSPLSGATPACAFAEMRGMGGRAPVAVVPPADACRSPDGTRLALRPNGRLVS